VRALVVALALMLSACGGLKMHAEVASASASALKLAREQIMAEEREDYEHGQAQGIEEQKLRDDIDARFATARAAWDAAWVVVDRYVREIEKARDDGVEKLGQNYARDLVDAWGKLAEAGESVGIAVPAPPDVLVKATGGK
jgi:Flp pilus assembly protein TadD